MTRSPVVPLLRCWLAIIVIVAVAILAVGASATRASTPSRLVESLTMYRLLTPPLRVRCYDTSGTYPQVSGVGLKLGAVNTTLKNAVLANQRAYAAVARGMGHRCRPNALHGVYQTATDKKLVSASTVVVSALIPDLELFSGGNDGAGWIAVTALVPSGAPVRFLDLIEGGRHGLKAFVKVVRGYAQLARDGCIRAYFTDQSFSPGVSPLTANYRSFALVASGFAIGFPNYGLFAPGCGRTEVTVPYALLRPYLSSLGKQLVAGVRSPR